MIVGQIPSIVDNIFTNIFEKNLMVVLIGEIKDHIPNFLFIADFIAQQKSERLESEI